MAIETYEYTITGTLAGQFVQTIFHFNLDNTAATDSFTVALAIIAKSNAAAGFLAKFCDCLPNDYTITSVRCRRILADGGPTAIYLGSALAYNNGTRSGAAQTSSACSLVIWLTSLRPSKSGRTFMPGLSIDDCADNLLTAGIITAINTWAAIFRDGFTLTSPAYATSGAILRRELDTADDISNFRISPVIGQQRRRQRPI